MVWAPLSGSLIELWAPVPFFGSVLSRAMKATEARCVGTYPLSGYEMFITTMPPAEVFRCFRHHLQRVVRHLAV